MANPNTLGKFLRSKRKEEGLTGSELAKITGVSQSRMNQIELGYVHSPSMYIISKLSDWCELTPLELAKMVDLKDEKLKNSIKELEKAIQ